MKKFFLFTSVICVFLMLGCNKGSKIKEGIVRVAYMPYYASVPMQVIIDEGLDKKYDFELVAIRYPDTGAMTLLETDQWDIAQIGARGMNVVPKYDAKLIADIQYEMDGAWILAREDSSIVKARNTLTEYPDVIGSIETVKSAEILIGTIGNIAHYMAIDYVRKFGLDVTDVKFINMKTDDIPEAFLSGEGDIACFGTPTIAMDMVQNGYVRVGGLKQQGISQQDVMLASAEYYDKAKDDIVKFMKAWYEAAAMLNADASYEFEMTKKFYTANGREVTDASVIQECDFNSYIDAGNFYDKKIGNWMLRLIKCYVEIETVDANTLVALEKNIKTELAESAIHQLK